MSLKLSLENLGYKSYAEYLASPSWADFKYRYRRSGRPMECEVCGSGQYELHHVTYRRIGRESLDDVTPLCRSCHASVHRVLDSNKMPVEATRKAIAIITGRRPAKKQPSPRDKGHGFARRGPQKTKKRFSGAAKLVARGMPSSKCIKIPGAQEKAKQEAADALEEYRKSRGIPIRK